MRISQLTEGTMIKTFDMSSGAYEDVEEIRVTASREEIRQPTTTEAGPALQLQHAVPRTIPVYQHGWPLMPQTPTVADETEPGLLH